MDAKKLESMKYNELQKLAKQNGIKANMKVSFNTVDQSDSLYIYIMIVIIVIMNDQFSTFDMLSKKHAREKELHNFKKNIHYHFAFNSLQKHYINVISFYSLTN